MNYTMWRYVSNPKHGLNEGLAKPVANYFSIRAIIVPVIFILMAFVYFIFPHLAVWMPMLIPLSVWLLTRKYRKKINFAVK
jgi:phage shock protein PspC (stress-responsive transcriptional regulator)